MTVLDDIVAAHRAAAGEDHRDLDELLARAGSCDPTRPFRAALERPGLSVIAEIKRRSPSAGDLAIGIDPGDQARAYAAGGAAALSVLTDLDHFGGRPADLQQARAASGLPALRKDFTVDERDVADARLMGADAVLLIVAALEDTELVAFRERAEQLGMDALVEVHDELELARAMATGASLVGVNQRDLRDFTIDRSRAERLRDAIPAGVVSVAESGIRGPEDVPDGFDAVLVGELLVRSGDPAATVARLRGGSPGPPGTAQMSRK